MDFNEVAMVGTPTQKEIDVFIQAISEPRFEGMFNPWSEDSDTDLNPGEALARRERLRLHLSCPDPKILLNWRGLRVSGL